MEDDRPHFIGQEQIDPKAIDGILKIVFWAFLLVAVVWWIDGAIYAAWQTVQAWHEAAMAWRADLIEWGRGVWPF